MKCRRPTFRERRDSRDTTPEVRLRRTSSAASCQRSTDAITATAHVRTIRDVLQVPEHCSPVARAVLSSRESVGAAQGRLGHRLVRRVRNSTRQGIAPRSGKCMRTLHSGNAVHHAFRDQPRPQGKPWRRGVAQLPALRVRDGWDLARIRPQRRPGRDRCRHASAPGWVSHHR